MTALDELLPRWDFAERHQVRTGTDADDVVATAAELCWRDVPVFRGLLTVMSLGRARPPADKAVVETMTDGGFRVLARRPDEFVLGAAVRMDPPAGAVDLGEEPFAAFRDFTAAGHYRVAFGFVRTGDLLVTTTRVAVADEASRRRFARYWLAIRIPSGLIRREWLAGAKRRVQRPTAVQPRGTA